MQDKSWWPGTLKDIQDILKHCKTCKKHTSTPLLSKSVIPCDDGKPFDQWAINIIGPMPSNKQDKKFIITQLIFVRVGQLPNLQKPMMVTTFVGPLEVKLEKIWLS